MTVFSFQTIKAPTTGLYKDKGSKFYSFAYPVGSEAEIKEHLEALRKEFFDARHHCYAYRLGPEGTIYRAVDDGEPSHSAGDPILGQLRSKNITNVLLVVVRYFGGIKLGVGGLISAYKIAAEEALKQSDIITCDVMQELLLSFDYASTPDVMRLIKDFDLKILHQTFGNSCEMKLQYRLADRDSLFEKIELRKALGSSLVYKEMEG